MDEANDLEVMLGGQMKTDLQDISATNAQRGYSGSPRINYESPIETMGEGIILIDRRIYVQNMYQYISSLSQV